MIKPVDVLAALYVLAFLVLLAYKLPMCRDDDESGSGRLMMIGVIAYWILILGGAVFGLWRAFR